MSGTTDLVAVDVGGTHVRFAIASLSGGGVTLGETTTFATRNHAGLDSAWRAFAAQQRTALPRAAAVAVACPVDSYVLRLTNSDWTIDRSVLAGEIEVDDLILLNDFEAVAHAVAAAPSNEFMHLAGPDLDLPTAGVISVVGPGTGLGVAQLLVGDEGARVIATEGGHIGFAPAIPLDDSIIAALRAEYGRVSVERVVSGAGLRVIFSAMTGAGSALDDAALWQRGITGSDRSAALAVAEFCRCLGSVAGDIALAQGASALVIAGGLGARLAGVLPHSGFAKAFADKGRFAARMAAIPVRIITHPQPGLYGAAAAFAQEHTT